MFFSLHWFAVAKQKKLETLSLVSITGASCAVATDSIDRDSFAFPVSECQVRKDPNRFNGKVIRLSGTYELDTHGPFISSDSCELPYNIDVMISIDMSPEDEDYIRKLNRDQKLGSEPIDITVVGLFTVAEPSHMSDRMSDRTPFHLSISCLETAHSRKMNDAFVEPSIIRDTLNR